LEEEFEGPKPHEEALDESAEGGGFAQRVALMTAILATIGALFSYESGSAQNDAMFLKNESIIRQAEASDRWAEYQSKSIKSHLDEIAASLATDADTRARYTAEAARQDKDKAELKKQAEGLEQQSHQLSEQAEATLKPHHRLSLGMTLVQIAVALAAITVLTRRRWLIWCSAAAALLGLCVAATGFI
jgi:septal ring factor EnvC (AmiA/AmiB activator)